MNTPRSLWNVHNYDSDTLETVEQNWNRLYQPKLIEFFTGSIVFTKYIEVNDKIGQRKRKQCERSQQKLWCAALHVWWGGKKLMVASQLDFCNRGQTVIELCKPFNENKESSILWLHKPMTWDEFSLYLNFLRHCRGIARFCILVKLAKLVLACRKIGLSNYNWGTWMPLVFSKHV